MKKTVMLLIVLLLFGFDLKAQWQLQGLGYEFSDLTSFVEVVDSTTVWTFAFESGHQYEPLYFSRTTDGGNHWYPGVILGYNDYEYRCVAALDANTAWVVINISGSGFYQYSILKTQDGGQNWAEQFSGISYNLPMMSVHFWNPSEGIICGPNSNGYFEIYTTLNGGNTWTRVDSTQMPDPLYSQECINSLSYVPFSSQIWAGTTYYGSMNNRVLYSADKGYTWSSVPSPFQYLIWEISFQNENHGILRNPIGTQIAETYNQGQTWTTFNASGNYDAISDFCWIPGTFNTCFLSGQSIGCSFSYDGGHTWTAIDTFLLHPAVLQTAWADNKDGWVTETTEEPDPWNTGIWKFTGVLSDILEMDPRVGDVTFYPVPSSGPVNMVLAGFQGKRIRLEVVNQIGQQVYAEEFQQEQIQSKRSIDLGYLPPGQYVAHLQCDGKSVVKKLVLER